MKSSRHAKISGDFGEALILYWLSKHGFECARADHTGIDIIASNRITKELMGISVKCRTRIKGKEHESVTIKKTDHLNINRACKEFRCSPYFAIVVDTVKMIKVFIVSKPEFLKLAPKKKHSYWRMNTADLQRYAKNSDIVKFELVSETIQWWKNI